MVRTTCGAAKSKKPVTKKAATNKYAINSEKPATNSRTSGTTASGVRGDAGGGGRKPMAKKPVAKKPATTANSKPTKCRRLTRSKATSASGVPGSTGNDVGGRVDDGVDDGVAGGNVGGSDRREKNSTRIGLENFCRMLKKFNAEHGTNYSHANLFPCPAQGCIFFGLSKQLFKTKKQVVEYDLARTDDGKVDMSEDAWMDFTSSDQFCLTLLRHFTHNLEPDNETVSSKRRKSHENSVPPCLKMMCKRSKDKNYKRLKELLGAGND
jgi:hypothetical protein